MEKTQTDAVESASTDQGLVYEFAFHLLPTLGEDELANEVTGFKTLLEKSGATIINTEDPKPMELAYAMVKKQEGKNARFNSSFLGVIKFTISAEALLEFKEEVDLNKNVLRYLIIKTVRHYALLQNRPVFREVKPDESKIISKPVVEEKKGAAAKPMSDEELDKTIEELTA